MANFGVGDASYHAAGRREGLESLVEAFYGYMDSLPVASTIRAMHPKDLSLSKEKLIVFLTGWLGGPKEYATKFGRIRIPTAHAHLAVDEPERDAWMHCMERAANEQEAWSDEFRKYFLKAIAVPAERVRQASVSRRNG